MLEYNMATGEKSIWICATQNETEKNFPFTCSEAGEFFALKEFYTLRDHKDSFWLVYTVDGEGILEQEGEVLRLTKGTFALIDCRKHQKYYTAPSCDCWHHYWFHINGSGVESLFDLINQHRTAVVASQNIELDEYCKIILENAKQKTLSETLVVNINLHKILNSLATAQLFGEISETSRRDEMLAVAKYIRHRYKENVQVEELAQKYHLSKFYFIRIFKQFLGTTPYDYLLHYRITKAKELLCKTQWTTGKIGLYVGFKSESNFTAQFTRVVKTSPLKYKKENYFIET